MTRLFLKALKWLGTKQAIRLAWKYVIYDRAIAWAKTNDISDEIDVEFIEKINRNLEKILAVWP